MPRQEPTLIAAARSQMTASSPRGTFSQAELTGDRVIQRVITRSTLPSPAEIRAGATAPVDELVKLHRPVDDVSLGQPGPVLRPLKVCVRLSHQRHRPGWSSRLAYSIKPSKNL